MPEKSLDQIRAEREYYRERKAEIRQELTKAEHAFRTPITKENIGEIADGVAEALRRSGNAGLAAEYLAAFRRWEQLQRQVDADPGNDDVLDEYNEAAEDMERVGADAAAWFDPLDRECGA
jgi:hypothetical protein